MKFTYKGYEIESTSEQLVENNKWTTAVDIISNQGSHVITKKYYADNVFDSKEEADKRSIIFGQQIIDGIYKEFSL